MEHPEPRIMTTATLEQIAADEHGAWRISLAIAIVARELLALRECTTKQMLMVNRAITRTTDRLDALERVQRDAVVDADLALDTYTREVQDDLADVTAERDALRDLLEQYAAVDEGLGLHLPNCRKHVYDRRSSPCTCGLAAALASATPAEGGEG